MAQMKEQVIVQFSADIARYKKDIADASKVLNQFIGTSDTGVKKASQAYNSLGKQFERLTVQMFGMYQAYNTLRKVVNEGLNFNKFVESSTSAFAVMMKSTDLAKQKMQDLYKFAVDSPLTFKETVAASKQLMAYGFAAEELIPNMKMLGTVAKATGHSLDDISYVYGTLRTQGRAYTRDLMQFAMRGIPIYEELAKVLGKPTEEIQKMTEAGKVGFAEVEQAFKNMTSYGGKFAGYFEEYMKTFEGKMAILSDVWQQTAGLLTKGLFDKLKPQIDNLTSALRDNSQVWEEWGEAIGNVVGGAAEGVRSFLVVLKPISNILLTIVDVLSSLNWDVLLSGLGIILMTINPVAGGIVLLSEGISLLMRQFSDFKDTTIANNKELKDFAKTMQDVHAMGMSSAGKPDTVPKDAGIPDFAKWLEAQTGIGTSEFLEPVYATAAGKQYIKSYEILAGKATRLYIQTFADSMADQKAIASMTGDVWGGEDTKKVLEKEKETLLKFYAELKAELAKEGQTFADTLADDKIIARLTEINTELSHWGELVTTVKEEITDVAEIFNDPLLAGIKLYQKEMEDAAKAAEELAKKTKEYQYEYADDMRKLQYEYDQLLSKEDDRIKAIRKQYDEAVWALNEELQLGIMTNEQADSKYKLIQKILDIMLKITGEEIKQERIAKEKERIEKIRQQNLDAFARRLSGSSAFFEEIKIAADKAFQGAQSAGTVLSQNTPGIVDRGAYLRDMIGETLKGMGLTAVSMLEGTDVGKGISGSTTMAVFTENLMKAVMQLEGFSAVLNYMVTIVEGMMEYVGPMIEEVFMPFAEIIRNIGRILGALFVTILGPSLTAFGDTLTWLNDDILVPLANILIKIINLARAWAGQDRIKLLKTSKELKLQEQMNKSLDDLASAISKVAGFVQDDINETVAAIKSLVDSQVGSLQDLYEVGAISGSQYEQGSKAIQQQAIDAMIAAGLSDKEALIALGKTITGTDGSTLADLKSKLSELLGVQSQISNIQGRIGALKDAKLVGAEFDAEKAKIQELITALPDNYEADLQTQLNNITSTNTTTPTAGETSTFIDPLAGMLGGAAAGAGVGAIVGGPVGAAAGALIGSAVGLIGSTISNLGSMLGWWAVGTPNLAQDQMGVVHKGEMIVPRTFSDAIRSGELSLSGTRQNSGNNIQVIVNVNGSVTAENDLATTIANKIYIQKQRGYLPIRA